MILFCCASELGLPEDLSAIEVILYYYYYYYYFKQHGLRVNLEKTEVLSIGACRELNIKLEGRTIRQNNSLPTLVEQ